MCLAQICCFSDHTTFAWYHYWSHFLIYPLQSWDELHFGSEHCGWLTELPPILWLPIRILSSVLKEGIRQTLDRPAELRLSRTEPTGKSSSAGLLLRGHSLLICGQSRKQQCRTNTNTGKMAWDIIIQNRFGEMTLGISLESTVNNILVKITMWLSLAAVLRTRHDDVSFLTIIISPSLGGPTLGMLTQLCVMG